MARARRWLALAAGVWMAVRWFNRCEDDALEHFSQRNGRGRKLPRNPMAEHPRRDDRIGL